MHVSTQSRIGRLGGCEMLAFQVSTLFLTMHTVMMLSYL
jgi:hypothetical protein